MKIVLSIFFLVSFLVLNSSFVYAETSVSLPIIGAIAVDQMSVLLSTILIATADGFNPCSIWVLLFLLGMILHTGSRKKILIIGLTFLLTTAIIYGLFIASIFTIMTILGHITWIVTTIAILALLFGLINVKDYFFFKKGISLTISDKYKPGFFKKVRELVKVESTFSLIILTVIMAAGIAIVELPCTAGLPAVWSGLIHNSEAVNNFYMYLFVYLFMYLLIEILILSAVLITLRSFKMDEFKGRVLKLIGGVLIIALALVLLIDRTLIYSISSIFILFFIALLICAVIVVLDLYFRKKFSQESNLAAESNSEVATNSKVVESKSVSKKKRTSTTKSIKKRGKK